VCPVWIVSAVSMWAMRLGLVEELVAHLRSVPGTGAYWVVSDWSV
jgi:hypothetical protein